VSYNYKLLPTTREDDWYHYAGNLSNVKSLRTVEQEEARQIYDVLKNSKATPIYFKLGKCLDKSLLIEYIYLLTHGEMLSES